MPVSMTPVRGEKIEKFAAMHDEDGPEQRRWARFGESGCILKTIYADGAQKVKDFAVREDDVWIVTAPKCGTTWTQEMVWLLLNNFDYDRAMTEELFSRSPYMEFSCFIPKTTTREFFKNLNTLTQAANLTPPRCIKSHLPKDLLPDELWTKKPKVIYVAREPKDAAVSYFHHEKLLSSFSGDKEFFFECFYEDLVAYCPLWEHVLDFWKMKEQPNILFNTYEEMKQDLPAVIRRTAQFLDKTVTDGQVDRLAEHLDFKQMKNNPAVNIEDKLYRMREDGRITEDQAFIRKGVVGEGIREMSQETVALYDERTRRVFNEAVGGCPWKI